MKLFKIVEIGPYPPPASGWSVRIKYVKEAFEEIHQDCKILNLGKGRRVKSSKYIDVQGGFDYVKKMLLLRMKGYHFHIHMNAQAVKGPILSLLALVMSVMTFERAAITFHGGIDQLYFPRENGRKMYWVIYLNFLLSGIIICNNEEIKSQICSYGPFVSAGKIHPIPAFSRQYINFGPTTLPMNITKFSAGKKFIISCYIVLRNGFYIETLLKLLERLSLDAGVILVGIREVEDQDVLDFYNALKAYQDSGSVLLVEDLDHNEFMTLLSKSHIYLRTPISDGVASSVLEALSLKVPVVASENGRRPESVLTYSAENIDELEDVVNNVLNNYQKIRDQIAVPEIKDTVRIEVDLLMDSF